MADDNEDKTEQPTERRRQEVREEGNIARSVDLNAAALLLAAASAMYFYGLTLITGQAEMLDSALRSPAWQRIDAPSLMQHLQAVGGKVLSNLLPFMGIMAAAALAVNYAQVGFLVTTEAIQPKLSRLNPLSGLQRIASIQSLVKLGVSLGKLSLLGLIAAVCVAGSLDEFVGLPGAELSVSASVLGGELVRLAFYMAIVLLALAVADYGFQYWKFEKDIRMTKQEIREEMRHMEGDPHIRQRRREAHRKLATSRQMQQVKEADVIITNPTHIAIAIKYDADTMPAPIVLAKGMGVIAERIRELAKEHKVPIVEKKPLAQALYKTVKVGHAVPVELYEVVAEILAYVYRISGKAPKRA